MAARFLLRLKKLQAEAPYDGEDRACVIARVGTLLARTAHVSLPGGCAVNPLNTSQGAGGHGGW